MLLRQRVPKSSAKRKGDGLWPSPFSESYDLPRYSELDVNGGRIFFPLLNLQSVTSETADFCGRCEPSHIIDCALQTAVSN